MIDILIDDDVDADLPNQASIESAVRICCQMTKKNINAPMVCIRFAPNHVVQALNAQWRNKDNITDVLSFPMQDGHDYQEDESLGDIILAMPFVSEEAQRLQRPQHAHILHLIIHGTLHLLGYDHIQDDEADMMQQLENDIMHKLGLHQPYNHEPAHV